MKKFLLYTFFSAIYIILPAQDEHFVSTTPLNKNIVLEEYTGVNCINCPDGHLIANRIARENPGRSIIINIHAGSYAANTYTTDEGTVLQTTFGVNAFPLATINRHTFSGIPNNFLLSRNYWISAADTIFSQPSPVNIAARGTLDWTTRELNITVQLYYTADETDSINLLNVAILQNNVIGDQEGYYYNPAQVVGSRYRHMHILRHLITGQWGDSIRTTTTGSFVERTYNLSIPDMLGSPNAIEAKLEDLTFVAFVARGQQEILTGCEVEMENINLPEVGVRLKEIAPDPVLDCSDNAAITATVRNIGTEPISALTFEYRIAGGAASSYQWNGQISSLDTAKILLPQFATTPNANQTVTAKIINTNGQEIDGEEFSTSLKKMVAEGTNTMTLRIKTDGHAQELSYKLYNSNNEVVQQSSPSQFTNNTICEFPLNLPEAGCYRMEVSDAGGNGITSGYVRLYNASDEIVFNATGNSFSSILYGMISFGTVDISDITMNENALIFPNPTTNDININSESDIQMVEIYNLQGQRVAAKNGNVRTLNVSELSNGMYLLKVTTEKGVSTYKISKQ